MADPQPASQVAKTLGIYLSQIYPLVEKGLVKNHKPDGKYNVEGGKGLEVDLEEVRAAMANSKKRGGKGSRGPKKGSKAHAKADPAGAEAYARTRKESFPVGTILIEKPYIPMLYAHVVTGRYKSLVYMERDPDRLTNRLQWTDTARAMLAKGIANIARPEAVLGMIMFSWIATDHLDLAASLEEWCEANGLNVSIPEPIVIDIPDEPDEPEEATDEEDDED